MTYDKLVARVADATGQSPETVRDILYAVPDALVTLVEGEQVRTPLGVFRLMRRHARPVIPPGGVVPMRVDAELVCKLRPGLRLRKRP